jgi:hypothetical protein
MIAETSSPERLTPGNVDNRKPLPHLAQRLFGKLLGDKGYLSQQLFERLFAQGIELLTPIRRNMKTGWSRSRTNGGSRKRAIIETINDQLKNISQIEHSRLSRAQPMFSSM